MSQVNPASLTNWQNGQTITAELYKQEREILYTSINDNYTRIINLQSTTAGSSGSQYVGSAPITGVTGTTVYTQLQNIFSQLSGVVLGQIPDASITLAKLSSALQTTINNKAEAKDIVGSKVYSFNNLGGF